MALKQLPVVIKNLVMSPLQFKAFERLSFGAEDNER